MEKKQYIELYELQSIIKDKIGQLELWVKLEISSVKQSGGHHYFEFIQKAENGDILAKIDGRIWRSNSDIINFFSFQTGEVLRPGLSIVALVRFDYHSQYGGGLTVLDIDPTFTLGELEKQRRETLAKLSSEGLLERQKELSLPILPSKIAVISAENAAGYEDFCKHLQENSFPFECCLFPSVMQGEMAPKSIAENINKITGSGVFDIILILRGGGADSDLYCYDDYSLCKVIAQCPLAIITAIGHQRDRHIADMVSFCSVKTPTALADYIISWVKETCDKVEDTAWDIEQSILKLIDRDETLLREWTMKLKDSILAILIEKESSFKDSLYQIKQDLFRCIDSACQNCEKKRISIQFDLNSRIEIMKRDLALFEERIKICDPKQILSQGYCLATDQNGRIIKKAHSKEIGDEFYLKFKDGTWKNRITSKIFE